ncbi:unnamed protein product [Amoebophrya sp. A120]|nr:unnamed protein product [Amoebophrya sp. A120]|eukprot:GSA120T00008484001.1
MPVLYAVHFCCFRCLRFVKPRVSTELQQAWDQAKLQWERQSGGTSVTSSGNASSRARAASASAVVTSAATAGAGTGGGARLATSGTATTTSAATTSTAGRGQNATSNTSSSSVSYYNGQLFIPLTGGGSSTSSPNGSTSATNNRQLTIEIEPNTEIRGWKNEINRKIDDLKQEVAKLTHRMLLQQSEVLYEEIEVMAGGRDGGAAAVLADQDSEFVDVSERTPASSREGEIGAEREQQGETTTTHDEDAILATTASGEVTTSRREHQHHLQSRVVGAEVGTSSLSPMNLADEENYNNNPYTFRCVACLSDRPCVLFKECRHLALCAHCDDRMEAEQDMPCERIRTGSIKIARQLYQVSFLFGMSMRNQICHAIVGRLRPQDLSCILIHCNY